MWGICGTEGLYTCTWEVPGLSIGWNAGYFDKVFYDFPQFIQTSVVSASLRVQFLSNPFQFITIPAVDALYFSILIASETEQ